MRGERSKREILRRERIHWETLKKILEYSEPPGYRLKEPRPKPKIGPYLERIAQIIEEDKALPKKQRHTAKRIYERIREMGYEGKYTQVKEAVRGLERVKREVFMCKNWYSIRQTVSEKLRTQIHPRYVPLCWLDCQMSGLFGSKSMQRRDNPASTRVIINLPRLRFAIEHS